MLCLTLFGRYYRNVNFCLTFQQVLVTVIHQFIFCSYHISDAAPSEIVSLKKKDKETSPNESMHITEMSLDMQKF